MFHIQSPKISEPENFLEVSSSASLLLRMQELKERDLLSMVTQASRGVELGSEPKTRLIVDLSLKCRKGIY